MSSERLRLASELGRPILPVVLALALFVLGEAVLQVRAHLRHGQSVASLAQPTYLVDATTGLLLLAPSRIIKGERMRIQSNSWGLRSDEIPAEPAAGELRVALLGASSIMGTYAPTNSHTAASLTQDRVRDVIPRANVINAGIAGLSLSDQVELLKRRLIPVGVQVLYWYPGGNDIYCERPKSRGAGIQLPALPKWLLTEQLLVKNTSSLRLDRPTAGRGTPRFDVDQFARQIDSGLIAAKDANIKVRLMTVAHAFSRAQSPAQRRQFAATALHFRPCFDVERLLSVMEEMNQILTTAARRHDVAVIDTALAMTGQTELFGDSAHFSVAGERYLSELLVDDLLAFSRDQL